MDARYTMTLYDARKHDSNLLDFIDFIDETHSEELKNAIISMWDIYEIAGETLGEQKKYMTDTFMEYKSYYAEKISEYDKKLEWNNQEFYTTYTDTTEGSKHIHSDLPNKQIDPDDYFSYPSDSNKEDSQGNVTSKDKSRLLSLRRQYLSQIKDYYREFALRFASDFLHMF